MFIDDNIITKLLKIGGDELSLYIFYARCCISQKTNIVKATDSFCMKGIGIGKVRFFNAKKNLLNHGMIEPLIRKKNGRITGHYIKVNHFNYSQDSFQESENIVPLETGNKCLYTSNVNASSNEEKCFSKCSLRSHLAPPEDSGAVQSVRNIFSHWVNKTKNIKGITTPQSIETKYRLSFKNKKYVILPLYKIISSALERFSEKDILIAIDNYIQCYTSKDHFYSIQWNLGKFLYSGITNGSGLARFLPSEDSSISYRRDVKDKDIVSFVRSNFNPTKRDIDITQPYNTQSRYYFGYETHSLDYVIRQIKSYDSDLKRNKQETINKYFAELESINSELLWKYKKTPDDKKKLIETSLKKYYKIWEKYK